MLASLTYGMQTQLLDDLQITLENRNLPLEVHFSQWRMQYVKNSIDNEDQTDHAGSTPRS